MHLPHRLKRFTFGLLLVLGVIGLVLFIGRASFNRIGLRRLAEVTGRLDAADPHWRLDEIEAARLRAAPPPDQNPAAVVLGLAGDIPLAWEQHRNATDGASGFVTNQHPSFQELLWYLRGRPGTAAARAAARTQLFRQEVRARPAGRYPLAVGDNPWTTLLPHLEKARAVLALLDYDARLAALEGDPDRGVRAARTALVVGRSVGDEPFLVSQLVRMACARVAAASAVQVLAWGRPAEGLADLQAELLAEADYPRLLVGLRGERALLDRVFENLQTGKLSVEDFGRMVEQQPGIATGAALRFYRGVLPEDRAAALRIMTEYVDAARLPPHEQPAAFARVQLPPRPPEDFRYLLTNLFLPACGKVADGAVRTRADLLAAAAAVACERFRRARGRWPDSLAEIPKEILPEIPTDPFDGGPLKYKKLDDGVAVFAADTDPKVAQRRKDNRDPLAGLGQGWRLWNPDLRGVPAAAEPDHGPPFEQPVFPPADGANGP